MVGCVLSQLKPSELYILSCVKGFDRLAYRTAKNVQLFAIYPIHTSSTSHSACENWTKSSTICGST